MLALIAYCLMATTLIGLGALALEKAAEKLWIARRNIWLAAMALSFLLPITAITMRHAPAPFVVLPFNALEPLPAPASAPITASGQAMEIPAVSQSGGPSLWARALAWRHMDEALAAIWLTSSAAFIGIYGFGYAAIRTKMKRARREGKDGSTILFHDSLGPAVVGFWKPNIVLPEWFPEMTAETRELALAHELAHIASRDPMTHLAALVLLAAMPWNPALWWQLIRLRFAIEVDCDARIIRMGIAPLAYGEMLLSIGAHAARIPAPAIALTEPLSQLEKRIRIVTAQPLTHRDVSALAWILACAASGLACAQLPLPASPFRFVASAHPSAGVKDAELAKFAGYFEFQDPDTPDAILTIDADGDDLRFTPTGSFPRRLARVGRLVFLAGGPGDRFEFEAQGDALTRNQDGLIRRLVRVDEIEAARVEAVKAARMAEQSRSRRAIPYDSARDDRYLGFYRVSPWLVLRLFRDGDAIYVDLKQLGKMQLDIEADGKFFARAAQPVQFAALTDAQGKVVGIARYDSGRKYIHERITDEEANAILVTGPSIRRVPKFEVAPATLNPEDWTRISGSYRLEADAEAKIERVGDFLVLHVAGDQTQEFYPRSRNSFVDRSNPAITLTFADGIGDAASFDLTNFQGGKPHHAIRAVQ